MTELGITEKASEESIMIDQDLAPAPCTGELIAEDTAMHLFQIAALMLGNEQEAVALVEETLARTETDPCAQGKLAYTEARALLVQSAVQRMVKLQPNAFIAPATAPAKAGCIETGLQMDDLANAGLTADSFEALFSGAGRARMRDWLERLTPTLRAIFVLRAIAGQDSEQIAGNLRESGAAGAQGWRRDLVATAYRQALCSLASGLMSSRGSLLPA